MSDPVRDLLLLPGFMCDNALFDDMAPHLEARWRLRHGDVYSDDSIDGMARRVLTEAPERFALLGFSMGGFVARAMALAAPERVAALILIATSARASRPEETARKRALRAQLAAHSFKGMSRAALRRAIHPDHPDREALVERLFAMGKRLGGAVMDRQLSAERTDGYPDLPRVACPTLVIAAEDDVLRPLEEVQALAEGIPDADFELMPGVGHMIPLEASVALSKLVDRWLDRVV